MNMTPLSGSNKLVVVGGGAAGMMAAGMAAQAGAHVTLLEQNGRLGKKLLITGKGNETRQKYGTIYADCRTDVEYVKEYLEEYNHSPSHVLENQNLD